MATTQSTAPVPDIEYPESDGQPIAENTLQYRWIVTIHGGLDSMYRNARDVFVAADLLWYPIKGNNVVCMAPDIFVVFGRPKGDRGSYLQWEEDDLPPKATFEILSPSNRKSDMSRKFVFYETYGVDEYYIYDPDRVTLEGYIREGNKLVEIPKMDGWISPGLLIRFDMSGDELAIYQTNGRKFLTFQELSAQSDEQAARAEEERLARLQAQQRARKAEERAADVEKKLETAEAKAIRYAAKLRELGVEPNGE